MGRSGTTVARSSSTDGRSGDTPLIHVIWGTKAEAIKVADHYHGYTPQFNRFQYRWQVAMLARSGDIARAINWYSR